MIPATPPPRDGISERVWATQRFLDRFSVRLLLSAAIIASLLPIPAIERLDPLFLVVFGAEFALRGRVFIATRSDARRLTPLGEYEVPLGAARRRRGALALLALDLVALLSFVPLPLSPGSARWLRLFRLARMLLLARYWAPIILDLWGVMARRERARQVWLMALVVSGLSFCGAVVLHHLRDTALDVTDDGVVDAKDRAFGNLLWWAFRQVQDPGNMLAVPMTLPVVVISLGLTIFGLFLVSFLIGLGTDVVRELLELSRLRPPELRGHTVIVNISPSTQRLLHELMQYSRKLFPSNHRVLSREWFRELQRRGVGGPKYVVVGQGHEPPVFLRQPELSKIVYRERAEDEEELIARTDLAHAARILLLADVEDEAPDAETIRTLLTLVERVRDPDRSADREGIGRRVVIAEILDEANVGAARAALATAHRDFRGFIVPTEKLLALFASSIVRRPGIAALLEELLTSRGHEIYTCFFDLPGYDDTFARVPVLPGSAQSALDHLLDRGLAAEPEVGCVVPLGFLTYAERVPGDGGFDVHINPPDVGFGALGGCRGFVAIADNFTSIRRFTDSLCDGTATAFGAESLREGLPSFERMPQTVLSKLLVCGFRPGSVHLLRDLVRGMRGGEILVMVESEAARRRAWSVLKAQDEFVVRGEPNEEGALVLELDEGSARVTVSVADWMDARHLEVLPSGFGHVRELDAIIFVAGDHPGADKRTTTALLKLEQLFECASKPPCVAAEIVDGKLALRLEQRTRELGIDWLRVLSVQELRAYFLFQSVVVPGFDRVYAELLGSFGQSFVQLRPTVRTHGTCTFAELGFALRERGVVLAAAEDDSGTLHVAPQRGEPGARIEFGSLRAVWVIAGEEPSRV